MHSRNALADASVLAGTRLHLMVDKLRIGQRPIIFVQDNIDKFVTSLGGQDHLVIHKLPATI